MEKTKIQFSAEELDLMQNEQWILTKNRIIEKMATAFEILARKAMQEVVDFYPAIAGEICSLGYKVSRGEKYQGLPYLILDFPRIFTKEEVLAIRVLFWWGKYFSVTLHTKGKYAERVKDGLMRGEGTLDEDIYLSYSGDEWNHDVYHEDYTRLTGMTREALSASLINSAFLKLSGRLELTQWERAEKKLHEWLHQFLYLLNLSFQDGEKDL